jgi:acyl carrier protein
VDEKEAFKRVKKVVLAQLGATADSLTMATSFAKDLGADPVDLIELEFALEEEFGIEIPDIDAEKLKTVGEAVGYVKGVI